MHVCLLYAYAYAYSYSSSYNCGDFHWLGLITKRTSGVREPGAVVSGKVLDPARRRSLGTFAFHHSPLSQSPSPSLNELLFQNKDILNNLQAQWSPFSDSLAPCVPFSIRPPRPLFVLSRPPLVMFLQVEGPCQISKFLPVDAL